MLPIFKDESDSLTCSNHIVRGSSKVKQLQPTTEGLSLFPWLWPCHFTKTSFFLYWPLKWVIHSSLENTLLSFNCAGCDPSPPIAAIMTKLKIHIPTICTSYVLPQECFALSVQSSSVPFWWKCMFFPSVARPAGCSSCFLTVLYTLKSSGG